MIATTNSYNRIVKEPLTNITIRGNKKSVCVVAKWDTGASRSFISKRIVSELVLTPSGDMRISEPSSIHKVPTYLVDFELTVDMCFRNLEVGCVDIENQGINALIGMDVIVHGDFSISNLNEKTVVTFRVPSMRTIDYTKSLED